ncbi:MAG TPA: MerR family transcriptional regulator [Thermoanaerobaculia bacterium]|jgi:DNA-binding transcriptional MerR regulator|nr:MerR family transcriptional regulator [Thermoanaerobaculia bacterium]
MVDETPAERPLRAGELARRTGVSKDTLRFYERQGLLPRPERLANNYRLYPAAAVERVLWIRRVLAAGFTVAELSRILAQREHGGIPCREVRELGAIKLAALEERLRELAATRDALQSILAEWDLRLAEAAPGERARLLESMPEMPRQGQRKTKEIR